MATLATEYTADQALQRLKDGNARFVRGEARFPTRREVLAELTAGQSPYATILGCSDSRVPPELIFDAEFGELFVIRVAGNVLGPAIVGTLQYAESHLHTPLFVVLGHEGCGAVDATLAQKYDGAAHKSHIEFLLREILPALEGLDSSLPPEELLRAAVEANVRHTIQRILAAEEVHHRVEEGHMRLVGAIYELGSGKARFLE
jgi:carbonic anhydrase